MKIASACQQCRSSKRRCIGSDAGPRASCVACQNRKLQCSKLFQNTKRQELAIKVEPRNDLAHYNEVEPLPISLISECVELYMRFVHDAPHSLFHEQTLWNEIRTDSISECLVAAICAIGCRFSDDPTHSELGVALRERSSLTFGKQLETISLANVQTCILLANLYAAEQNNNLEALYFGIANRMAHVLRLHETNSKDCVVIQETKCRVYWSLFMADRWCPPALGLPREISSTSLHLKFPMDEAIFQSMTPNTQAVPPSQSDGLWKYMVTLADILGPIQDLNQSLVSVNPSSRASIASQVSHLAYRLQAWHDNLPMHMLMNDLNLAAYRRNRQGSTFVALHFGYHHYCTLLYFQYLDPSTGTTSTSYSPSVASSSANITEIESYASWCRHHALSFSRLLQHARTLNDCPTVYLTVAYMTMVSSSVLLHTFLFSENSSEVDIARVQLTRNFEALVDLRRYWPHLDRIAERLLTFQKECLSRTCVNGLDSALAGGARETKTHVVDGWMVRFLLQHSLPLDARDAGGSSEGIKDGDISQEAGHMHSASIDVSSKGLRPSQLAHEVPLERKEVLDEVFRNLC